MRIEKIIEMVEEDEMKKKKKQKIEEEMTEKNETGWKENFSTI